MSSEHSDRGFVVVTGTSTGIGAVTALHLAESGFHVFAGVRRPEDGDALRAKAPELITPVMIDVTDGSMIETAAATIDDAVGDRGLAGMVNNAGIAKPPGGSRRACRSAPTSSLLSRRRSSTEDPSQPCRCRAATSV